MNTDSCAREGRSDPCPTHQPSRSEGPGASTHNPELQAEHAGNTDSGTAATRAMKQTSKTAAEIGKR